MIRRRSWAIGAVVVAVLAWRAWVAIPVDGLVLDINMKRITRD